MKRFFDLAFSLAALILVSPLMALAALLIRLDSAGPILFTQDRVGVKGRIFRVLKFRTMIEDAEAMGPIITAKNDPRITRIGHLLRWLKIDELPQLFNVLKGDMAVVGPRPEVPQMVATYSDEEREVLEVKPGIIGPSQISNRDEEAQLPEGDSVEQYYAESILPAKMKKDLSYVRNKSAFKDWRILFSGTFSLILSSVKLSYILESRRRIFFLAVDMMISAFSYWAAYALRFEGTMPDIEWEIFRSTLPFLVVVRASCFIYFGLYQTLWQYLDFRELISIAKAVTAGSLLTPFIPFLFKIPFPARSVMIIDCFMLTILLGASRILFKLTSENLRKPRLSGSRQNILIIGAGDTTERLVREFITQPYLGFRAVGFLDDDPLKMGMHIHGVKVVGTIQQLPQFVRVKKVHEVVIGASHVSSDGIERILKKCRDLHVTCRIVPASSVTLTPKILPLKLRPVQVEDLLGRELVHWDDASIQHFFGDKKVLVTGAGGSIGSELSRILFRHQVQELILVDFSENNLFTVESELRMMPGRTRVASYLEDVTNWEAMDAIFGKHKPHVVYHAAASKHVPLTEIHFVPGIINNVHGTKVVADLALRHGVDCFVLISTDKAVRPRSIMGATKRIAERYIQSLKSDKSRFLAVRFGNVFNSAGSVIPLFRKQIEEGGPLTITDPEVKRYFMDVSEAVALILQATLLGSNNEIFVLDMGEPVKIVDLARKVVQVMGLNPNFFPVKYVGLRPGEKLVEELELHNEKARPTSHKRIKVWQSHEGSLDGISRPIEELLSLVRNRASRSEVVRKLNEIVPEYEPWNPPL